MGQLETHSAEVDETYGLVEGDVGGEEVLLPVVEHDAGVFLYLVRANFLHPFGYGQLPGSQKPAFLLLLLFLSLLILLVLFILVFLEGFNRSPDKLHGVGH